MNYNILAMGIILQAMEDYRTAKKEQKSTLELENFFMGEWCEFLLCNMKITGKDILTFLERE
jgi:hypothetical protein